MLITSNYFLSYDARCFHVPKLPLSALRELHVCESMRDRKASERTDTSHAPINRCATCRWLHRFISWRPRTEPLSRETSCRHFIYPQADDRLSGASAKPGATRGCRSHWNDAEPGRCARPAHSTGTDPHLHSHLTHSFTGRLPRERSRKKAPSCSQLAAGRLSTHETLHP